METRVRQNEADCKEVSDKASEMMRATRTLSNRIINNKIFDFTLFLSIFLIVSFLENKVSFNFRALKTN